MFAVACGGDLDICLYAGICGWVKVVYMRSVCVLDAFGVVGTKKGFVNRKDREAGFSIILFVSSGKATRGIGI